MAITILGQPTTPNVTDTKLVYSISSSNALQPQFQYVTDVKQGGTLLTRLYTYPNPTGNGIVEVSAKDQATGKQQSIKITASSGLTQEEIDRLVKDAELHSEEDRRRKDLVEARNAADGLIYTTEKTMAELKDKIDDSTRAEVLGAISNLKRAMEGDDVSEIKRLTEVLTHASHSLASTMYQQSSSSGCQGGTCGNEGGYEQPSPGTDEEVVDADFREVA